MGSASQFGQDQRGAWLACVAAAAWAITTTFGLICGRTEVSRLRSGTARASRPGLSVQQPRRPSRC
jgi:hypothetical protein